MKRYTTFLLLLCMLLASCGGSDAPADNTTTAPETTADLYPDDLPDDLDFGGETVTFLYRQEILDEFYVDSQNGDIVNDALYDSLRAVEERLNINIEAIPREGHLTNVRDEYMNHITSTVMAGDGTYDWVDLMIGNACVKLREGIFRDLTQLDYLDFAKPWYLKELTETVAIDDKLYYASGDVSIGYLKNSFCLYFNKRLAEDYKLGSLYELVDEGKWTVDKVAEIAAAGSQDLDGNGRWSLDDSVGFVIHDYTHKYGFMGSTQIKFFEQNDTGDWEYVLGSERDADICEALYALINQSEGVYFYNGTNAIPEQIEGYNKVTDRFVGGGILIMTAQMDDAVTQLRTMQDAYGVLPYPKLDEAQKEYQSSSRSTHNSFSMPVTCENPEMAAAVYEALGASNYEKLLPAYFEVAMKAKYSSDDESARMFDIIHDSFKLDFGYMFNNALSDPTRPYWVALNTEGSFASTLASKKPVVEEALAKFMEDVEANCE
ncbi:MAG: hypothetical protein E7632_00005 [Ruminococcaceae bacterium]|nr:hypothetical protein [Oscillospiraceae bacterium]